MHTARRIAAVPASLLAAIVLATCSDNDPPATPGPAAAVPGSPAAAWLGRWTGPEGTWLELASEAGEYTVTVRDLDGESKYPAIATPDGVRFVRNGAFVELRATDGRGTGMKWLAEKSDCLVIEPGEGFCRD